METYMFLDEWLYKNQWIVVKRRAEKAVNNTHWNSFIIYPIRMEFKYKVNYGIWYLDMFNICLIYGDVYNICI